MYKKGIDTTAPTAMVKPRRYIGALISSFRYTNRNVSMNPHKLPMTNIKTKNTHTSKLENISFIPLNPVDFGSLTSRPVHIKSNIPVKRNTSWEINGIR